MGDRLAEGHRRRRRFGTAARLAAFQGLILAFILAVVVLGLVREFSAQSHTSASRQLTSEAQAFAAQAQSRPKTQGLPEFTRDYLAARTLPDNQVDVVILPGAKLLGSAGSGALLASGALEPWVKAAPARSVLRTQTVAGRPLELLVAPLMDGDTATGVLVTALDRSRLLADERRVLHLAVGEALVALIAASAAGYLLLRRLLTTVGRVTTTAAGLGRGHLDRRLGDQGYGDEVGELAATFDVMADHIAAAIVAQRRLLSDVSHQLRTPLTVARGHLEVLGRTGAGDPKEVEETLSVVVDELDHMGSLVERLLMLGAALEPDFLETAPLDLRTLLADLVESAHVLGDRDWSLGPVPDLTLVADGTKLRGALLNLLDNAARVTKPGDAIAVTCVRQEDSSLVVLVDDSGPGITPEQRAMTLTRFRRPISLAGHNSGLGLAIVKAVVEAHGGRLFLDNGPLGGCRVRVLLPPDLIVEPS